MAVVQITSREFRNKQASVFDLADKGTRVIIRRGRKQAYMLAPVSDEELNLSPEAEENIRRSREEYARGEEVVCCTSDELHRYLEML